MLQQLKYIRVYHTVMRPNYCQNNTNSTISKLFYGLLPLYVTIKNTFHMKKQQLSADLNLLAKTLKQLDTY